MHWLSRSLNRKFAVATAAGLLMSSLFFLVLFVNLYRGQLEQELGAAAAQWGGLLAPAFEDLIQRDDRAGLEAMVRHLAGQPGILDARLTDGAGEVRFATDPAAIGDRLAISDASGSATGLMEGASGAAVLRSVHPLGQVGCVGCAGAGMLHLDFDAAPISEKARATTLLLMGSGALIVLINIAGGWWFIRRFVIRPLEQLSQVSARLSRGELDARLVLPGGDELSALAARFNGMAEGLMEKIRQLEDKEVFLQALVDAIPDGIRVIDADYRVLLANAAYRQQHGYADGREMPELCYAATHGRHSPCPKGLTLCPLEEVTGTGEPLRVVHRHLRADASELEVEVYAAPLHASLGGPPRPMVVESIRDLEQQVRFSHEQRLSELGRLAAGVAHEIHNPLAAVRMALHAAGQAALEAGADCADLTEYLDLVDHEVETCIEVTGRLLKLSVPPPSQRELVELDGVVQDTLALLAWEAANQQVEIRYQVEGAPLRVLAADSDLRMVTLNLAQNAFHAMPGGGTLTVRCWRDGAQVSVLVEDSGVGIEPQDLGHIFEPFFSRRADGLSGTGLGLSITRSIVEGHGGHIAVESSPGRGSRFLVTLADADAPTARE